MMRTILGANARKLDLNSLVGLHLLLSHRNVTQVARALNMSQPAVSHMLARLRNALSDPLMVRDGSGFTLTPRGQTLLAQLETLMPDVDRLFAGATFDPATAHTVFRLAITDHAGQVLMPHILRHLTEQAPHVTTSMAVIPNRQIDQADLDSRHYDLRIGGLRSLPAHWHRRKLMDDQIVLICAIDHPELQEATVTPDVFIHLNHIALESENPIFPNLVESHLASLGLQRRVMARVSHFAIVPELVASTRMVAMFPRRLAETYARRGIIRIIDPPLDFPQNDLSMGWHPRTHRDGEHVWLRQQIVAIAKFHEGR